MTRSELANRVMARVGSRSVEVVAAIDAELQDYDAADVRRREAKVAPYNFDALAVPWLVRNVRRRLAGPGGKVAGGR